MEHFAYSGGNLHAEDISIATIAESVGTPFYCYSTATLLRHYRVFSQAFQDIPHQIHYALKANSNQAIIKTLAKEGAGADVVSEGEIRRALAAGIPASKIVFSGMGKTVQEIAYALDQDILQFNVESEPELETLSHIAQRKGKIADIAIRVTPDVDGKTHAKITTGTKVSKFGIDIAQAPALYKKAASLEGIKIRSVSCHIGSQITELEPFQKAFSRVVDLVKELRADGHTIDRLDLGGGLGIPYDGDAAPPTPAEYASIVKDVTRNLGCTLMFEPGRLIVGNAGILVSRVIAFKKTPAREFLVVDAGMNDLVRPTLYDAFHEIIPAKLPKQTNRRTFDVVGPVCETGDVFARDRTLPVFEAGDLVAFRSAGAYGASMSNTYNSRPLVAEVLVNGNQFAVIRPRQTYAELIAQDILPDWL
jgi:diaminopimelate decarboxylase